MGRRKTRTEEGKKERREIRESDAKKQPTR